MNHLLPHYISGKLTIVSRIRPFERLVLDVKRKGQEHFSARLGQGQLVFFISASKGRSYLSELEFQDFDLSKLPEL